MPSDVVPNCRPHRWQLGSRGADDQSTCEEHEALAGRVPEVGAAARVLGDGGAVCVNVVRDLHQRAAVGVDVLLA